ncbi:hypothetical protein B0T22DRAFT_8620 [Podospora appendiculata]|uniref:Uncharacterized protein n=1 Tax=Podospora appendiculata TaxID=314037 RepID=A0AAE1CFB7_9PEZI|nr:hypothetical protein B0T22DRAFT_8620 [Podospora appendiculata]
MPGWFSWAAGCLLACLLVWGGGEKDLAEGQAALSESGIKGPSCRVRFGLAFKGWKERSFREQPRLDQRLDVPLGLFCLYFLLLLCLPAFILLSFFCMHAKRVVSVCVRISVASPAVVFVC